jgi:hypothetical protein
MRVRPQARSPIADWTTAADVFNSICLPGQPCENRMVSAFAMHHIGCHPAMS